MVALSSRFAALAALCSIAAISLTSPANAAAISVRFDATSLEASKVRVDARAGIPVIPAPRGSRGPSRNNHRKPKDHMSRPSGDFQGTERDLRRREVPSEQPRVIMDGAGDSVSIGGAEWHTDPDSGKVVSVIGDGKHVDVPRSPHDHHHHGHEHDTVNIHGDDNTVKVHSRDPHHHHHHHDEHDTVNIHGDDNTVKIHSRDPHHHHGEHDVVNIHGDDNTVKLHSRDPHHHHHHHDEHDTVIIHGDDNNVKLHSRSGLSIASEIGVSYVVNSKRAAPQQLFSVPLLRKRDSQGTVGVPGRIDIMSPMADPSSPGQRIASLVLAQSNVSSSDMSAADVQNNTFVLNASPDNQTQMFLSRLPPTSAEMASDSTTPPTDVRVSLQMNVFDAASASTQTWCATFDPAPSAPAPLTAQPCFPMEVNGVNGPHTSQVFSFNTASGAISPMWFDPADGGTVPAAQAAAMDSASVDPETPVSAQVASVTDFTAPVRRDDTLSSSSSSSTTAPTSTSSSATPSAAPDSPAGSSNTSSSAAAAPSAVAAQEVMLMFTPDDPEVSTPSAAAMAADPATTDASAPATTTEYTTYWETVTVTTTATEAPSAEYVSTAASMDSSDLSSTSSASPMSSATMASVPTPTSSGQMAVEVVPAAASSSIVPSATPSTSTDNGMDSASPNGDASLPDDEVDPADDGSADSMPTSAPTATGNASTSTPSSSAATSPSMDQSLMMKRVSTEPYTWMFKRDSSL